MFVHLQILERNIYISWHILLDCVAFAVFSIILTGIYMKFWSAWLSGKVLDPRTRGLGFDSWYTGHVSNPWARFESTLPLATQQ
jgi:hypothetical protein